MLTPTLITSLISLGVPGAICLVTIIIYCLISSSQNKANTQNINKFSEIISGSIDKLCDKMDVFTEKIVENSVINKEIHEDIKEIKEDQKKIISVVEKIDNQTSKCWVNQNRKQNRQ